MMDYVNIDDLTLTLQFLFPLLLIALLAHGFRNEY